MIDRQGISRRIAPPWRHRRFSSPRHRYAWRPQFFVEAVSTLQRVSDQSRRRTKTSMYFGVMAEGALYKLVL